MRKLIFTVNTNLSSPPPRRLPPRSLPRTHSLQQKTIVPHRRAMILIPPIACPDSFFDIITLSLIAAVLLLSLLSLSFILHLRFKSRTSHHLQNFNSLWTVRFLLVSFTSLWALNELLRLPFFRHKYLIPLFTSLTFSHQADLCKINVVLSLGVFQPGFLVTLLFLVNVSIKKRNPRDVWAIVFVLTVCLPVLFLQIFFVFFSPESLPEVFRQSSVLFKDSFGNETVLCTYPLMSTIVFGAFGIAYSVGFLLSCWRVVSLVINKGLTVRIYALAIAVLIPLPIQIALMGISVLWRPDAAAYGGVTLVVLFSVFLCTAAGEVLLVIKPIADALNAGGDCCRWTPGEIASPEFAEKRLVNAGE
ncbi:hypothetical protein L1049_020586 [Liquidambar formosana]|uniref:Uncharacterized protein n=1 Tax=Liquidambar formosana TaxID=63359 RepID=A0AAP0S846_LIQFO